MCMDGDGVVIIMYQLCYDISMKINAICDFNTDAYPSLSDLRNCQWPIDPQQKVFLTKSEHVDMGKLFGMQVSIFHFHSTIAVQKTAASTRNQCASIQFTKAIIFSYFRVSW